MRSVKKRRKTEYGEYWVEGYKNCMYLMLCNKPKRNGLKKNGDLFSQFPWSVIKEYLGETLMK